MLHYRVLRAISDVYPTAVLGCYVAAMIVALAMMFIFPPGTLLLLGFGLAGLVLVVLLYRLLTMVVRADARLILGGGACPCCGRRMQTQRDESRPWACEWCEVTFLPSGAETDGVQSPTRHGEP